MIDDLLAHYNLRGKPKSEVIKLLGEPDDDELKRMKGNHCKPGQITYELGAELDNPMSFNREVLELAIENNRVSTCHVTVYSD